MARCMSEEQFKSFRQSLFEQIEALHQTTKPLIQTVKRQKGYVNRDVMLRIIALCKQQGFKPYQKVQSDKTFSSRYFSYVAQTPDERVNLELLLFVKRTKGEELYEYVVSSVIRNHRDGRVITKKSILLRLHDIS